MKFNGFELETLELRGLNNVYYKTNLNDKYEVYRDEESNNYILFTPYDDCNTESIVNGIRDTAYTYLINVLNKTSNTVVEWSQVEGTTSDYTIYYNINVNKETGISYNKINEVLSNIDVKSECRGYKYTEVKNGIEEIVQV